MLIEHKVTKKQYTVTLEAWARMKDKGRSGTYKVIEVPEVPKEVKNVRPAKAEKTESEINDSTRNLDRLPGKDAGEIE